MNTHAGVQQLQAGLWIMFCEAASGAPNPTPRAFGPSYEVASFEEGKREVWGALPTSTRREVC